MKVLHVITSINRGGAENHLFDLVCGQRDAGHSVAVCALKGNDYWRRSLTERGVRVENLGLKRYGTVRPVFRLRRAIDGFKPDIVHAHMPPAELYTRLALLLARQQPPLVISKHNDEPFYRGPGQGTLRAWVARRANAMIAISEAVNRYTRREIVSYSGPVQTIHYGISVGSYRSARSEDISALRREWNVPRDAWVVGTVARLVPQKSLHVLLDAYALYSRARTMPSRLVIVGSGPLEVDLKRQVVSLGIADSVVWAGFREDIPTVMNAFDAFVLTSKYEGFGLVLLEAMAAGRPIVSTAVSAIPEIVRDGQTGLLCPAGDAHAIAQAFGRLESPDLRAQFGAAGMKRAVDAFAVGRMIDQTTRLYETLLK